MGSNSSSHCKGDLEVKVPCTTKIMAKGFEIAIRINKNEQTCPQCGKIEGMSYTEKDDVYTFNTLRATMGKRIEALVATSTGDTLEGKIYIMYERLNDLQRLLPGKDDGERFRKIKHWRLVIQIGFDCFTLEFLENSIVSQQGVVMVGPYNQESSQRTLYPIGDLRISTEVLFNWTQEQFNEWTVYNLFQKNCQHFVHHFLAFVEKEGYLTNRTDHLAVPSTDEPSSMSRWIPVRNRVGEIIGSLGVKSKSLLVSPPK
ncbi:hypothetical protein BGX33_011226 [Mortierella sp. NVP41]|nr:hypothetical protein BGX33_011226 [Mortierella sp. NVP41]